MAQSFKTLIFMTIPLNLFVMILVSVSFATQEWCIGEAKNETEGTRLEYNFGLFSGKKTRYRGGTFTSTLKIVCASGVCMFSCGKDSVQRSADLQNLLSENPCSSTADYQFCEDSAKNCTTDFPYTKSDPRSQMIRYGSYVSVIFFISVGLLFTLVTFVFSSINSFSNPIETINGVHGLVLWNSVAALSYFLAIVIWAGEFHFSIYQIAPVSNLLRPMVAEMDSDGLASLGYSYWLIFVSFCFHCINLLFTIYYIRRRFKPKRAKTVDPTGNNKGNDMMF